MVRSYDFQIKIRERPKWMKRKRKKTTTTTTTNEYMCSNLSVLQLPDKILVPLRIQILVNDLGLVLGIFVLVRVNVPAIYIYIYIYISKIHFEFFNQQVWAVSQINLNSHFNIRIGQAIRVHGSKSTAFFHRDGQLALFEFDLVAKSGRNYEFPPLITSCLFKSSIHTHTHKHSPLTYRQVNTALGLVSHSLVCIDNLLGQRMDLAQLQ